MDPESDVGEEETELERLDLAVCSRGTEEASSEDEEDSDEDYEGFMDVEAAEEADEKSMERGASGTHGGRGTSEVAEDQRQDSDEADASSEPTLENCLYLNHVYQDLIHESIEDLELLLKLNTENQAALNDKIASSLTKRSTTQCSLDAFTCPYFKDANRHNPPPNEDAKIKAARGELVARVHYKKPWDDVEKKNLTQAVERDSMEKALHAVMSRKEMIYEELTSGEKVLSVKEMEKKKKQLREKDIELEAVRKSVKANPFGPVDANYDWLKISAVNFEGSRSAMECELFWKNYLHPSINKCKWSKEEVDRLAELFERHGRNQWETIARSLETGRTALQCFEKYQTKLNKDNLKGKWTVEEQERLKSLVETFKIGNYIPWYCVFYFMEGRSNVQIWHHWNYMLSPDIKKGRFTEEEDLLLVSAVWMLGPSNWSRIKEYVPGRTSAQCRERWANVLDPGKLRSAWTREEDEKVLRLVMELGPKWALIARHFEGRADSACRTRYNALVNHVTEDNTLNRQSEAAYVNAARVMESYRMRIYKRLVAAVRNNARSLGIENAAELKDFSKEFVIKNISALALDPKSRSRKQDREPLDRKLSGLVGKLPLDDLKRMFAKRWVRKPNPANDAAEKELKEYFVSVNQKKRRGRPFKFIRLDADDPGYRDWIGKCTQLMRGRSEGEPDDPAPCRDIPFLPPMTTTLDSFKSVLLQKTRMRSLPSSRSPCSPSADESGPQRQRTPRDDDYGLLFARFASLFFWPALLSVVKPSEEEKTTAPPQRRKGKGIREAKGKKRKKRKDKVEDSAKEPSEPTADPAGVASSLDTQDSAEPKKKRGRPRKDECRQTTPKAADAEVVPTRRSARKRKARDNADH